MVGLLVVGCGKHAPPTNDTSGRGKTVESTPTTTAKPVKELTAEEKVVGTYDDYDEGKRYLKPFSSGATGNGPSHPTKFPNGWHPQRFVFLENGIVKGYIHRANHPSPWYKTEEGKWKLTKEGELHDTYSVYKNWIGSRPSPTNVLVFSINKDGSITMIARIDALGKREEAPKEKQVTFKKIK